jgi:hypothetical protein
MTQPRPDIESIPEAESLTPESRGRVLREVVKTLQDMRTDISERLGNVECRQKHIGEQVTAISYAQTELTTSVSMLTASTQQLATAIGNTNARVSIQDGELEQLAKPRKPINWTRTSKGVAAVVGAVVATVVLVLQTVEPALQMLTKALPK